MRLEYSDAEGNRVEILLGNTEVLIGRSPQAHIVVPNVDASRLHASVRLWGDDYVVKDLGSENGTLVNGQRVEVAILRPGDRIRVGSCDILVHEAQTRRPSSTAIHEIEAEMAHGKGYSTIMREIVHEAQKPDEIKPPPQS